MSIFSKFFTTKKVDELTAEPISKDRMDLLWLDTSGLSVLKASIATKDVAVVPDDRGGVRKLQVTLEDIEWAENVKRIAQKASDASNREDYNEAIRFYCEALKLAPGCDLYLMSIGCCYGNMGQVKKGLPWVQRAAEISPQNARIQRNLALQKQLLAKGQH